MDISCLNACKRRVCFGLMSLLRLRGYHFIVSRCIKRININFQLKLDSKQAAPVIFCSIRLPVEMKHKWCTHKVTTARPVSCHKQLQSTALLNNLSQRTGCLCRHRKSRYIIYPTSLFTQKHNNPHRFGAMMGGGRTMYQQRHLQSLQPLAK